jgi:hypothetical protein
MPANGLVSGNAPLPVPELMQDFVLPAPGTKIWTWMPCTAPTDTDPVKTAKRRDHAYRVAQFASTSTFIPPPADIEDELSNDEEEEEAGEDEAGAEVEAPEEEAAAPPEQAPGAPVVPEAAPEPPVVQAQDNSSPLYHTP